MQKANNQYSSLQPVVPKFSIRSLLSHNYTTKLGNNFTTIARGSVEKGGGGGGSGRKG